MNLPSTPDLISYCLFNNNWQSIINVSHYIKLNNTNNTNTNNNTNNTNTNTNTNTNLNFSLGNIKRVYSTGSTNIISNSNFSMDCILNKNYDISNHYDWKTWKYMGSFLAIRPNFRPFPVGTKLYSIIYDEVPPHKIKEIKIVYESYINSFKGIHFIAWSYPTVNTIPLYIWRKNENIFVSFDLINKSSSSISNIYNNIYELEEKKLLDGWMLDQEIGIIYVIDPNKYSDIYNIKFRCNHGRIIPDGDNNEEIFDINLNSKAKSLSETIVECNIISKDKIVNDKLIMGGSPESIYDILSNKEEINKDKIEINKDKIDKIDKINKDKIDNIIVNIIIFIFFVFIILFIFFIIYSIKNTNK